jgi:hypothetical protein
MPTMSFRVTCPTKKIRDNPMKPGRIKLQASSYFCLIAEDTVYPNIDVLEFPDQFVVAHKFDKPDVYYHTPLWITAQPEKILHHRLGNIKDRALGYRDILKGREFRSECGHRRRMIIKNTDFGMVQFSPGHQIYLHQAISRPENFFTCDLVTAVAKTTMPGRLTTVHEEFLRDTAKTPLVELAVFCINGNFNTGLSASRFNA